MGTYSMTLEWVMFEMLLNPSMTRKVQEDIDGVVGLERKVEESDLPHLEILRLSGIPKMYHSTCHVMSN